MYRFTSSGVDVDQLRARLQRITEEQVGRFCDTAAYMCFKKANLQKPLMEANIVQLDEYGWSGSAGTIDLDVGNNSTTEFGFVCTPWESCVKKHDTYPRRYSFLLITSAVYVYMALSVTQGERTSRTN